MCLLQNQQVRDTEIRGCYVCVCRCVVDYECVSHCISLQHVAPNE